MTDDECNLDTGHFVDGDEEGYGIVCLNPQHADRTCPGERDIWRGPAPAALVRRYVHVFQVANEEAGQWVSYYREFDLVFEQVLAAMRAAAEHVDPAIYVDVVPEDYEAPVIRLPATQVIRVGNEPAPWQL